ncbi:MAG: excinuclease ABC subunit UvrB [Verrucomicrobia bacterium]|nr:excinuclease ABC subunit UvrB [Verrucomicrobiota bacterium]MCH8527874.1 excinuclease ABC subunit UvrB [Kiritimatiellia bacterium]
MPESLYHIQSDFKPSGDQPQAIDALCRGLDAGRRFQVLEGVTGSGKTFTMANVIAHWGGPTLIISHNKTLAAQLYAEMKQFLPENAVSYFVSYFDYYQPEAYIPTTDTFIEKDSSINEDIERLRLAATDALLNRRDVVIIASVSCIYGLGSPEDYQDMLIHLQVGGTHDRDQLLEKLVTIQYTRNEIERSPGTFRVRGDTVELYPSYNQEGVRISFWGDEIERIQRFDPLTGDALENFTEIHISPARHFVTPYRKIEEALKDIQEEMEARVREFEQDGRLIEAQRIRMRTDYDLEMLKEVGFCNGIENYSRYLTGRRPGDRPFTLLDYFREDFLTIIDESHVTLPQIRGMFNGDLSRKSVLVEHGFRLPSALDNRPLAFDEFLTCTQKTLFVSATPSAYEVDLSGGEVVRQIIRPTGIIDPEIEIRPLKGQIDDVMHEIRERAEREERVLVTTLTKRTAEDLAAYLDSLDLRTKYLHSDIDAIERVEILRALRKREFDCLIGINLLREGLDIPEVSLVAILDADKEGFLRSTTSLIQTAGRAARNLKGKVILYADKVTDSMQALLDTTEERRRRQLAYNVEHNITPQQIVKEIQDSLAVIRKSADVEESVLRETGEAYDVHEVIREMEGEMMEAAKALEYERAALLRDQIMELRAVLKTGDTSTSGKTPYRKKKGKKAVPKIGKPKH